MFSKILLLLLLYLGFVMVRGMYRTYKLLYNRSKSSNPGQDSSSKNTSNDENTFEADYKIIN